MSTAGVHSSRGDAYQTTLAAEWAIRALHDAIDWIEVDSTSLDPSGSPVSVDDIVVAYHDETKLYCQCKKNHPTHGNWTPSSLKDDLEKAGLQLGRDPRGSVRFYSRNNFGDLSRLVEHAITQPDNAAFVRTLPTTLEESYQTLQEFWRPALQAAGKTGYDWLRRIQFEVTSDFTDLRARQLGTLRQHVTQPERVYEALTNRLDSISRRLPLVGTVSRTASTDRLTQADLLDLLTSSGSIRTPPRSEAQLQTQFRQLSTVGRTWRRSIGATKLSRSIVQSELSSAISARPKTVLLHAGPGYGKTCVLLDLLDTIESSHAHFVVYLQGREFASCKSDSDRSALGLDPDFVGTVARAAELRPTIVIIDSIDVLSLSRENAALEYFLSVIDRLTTVSNVTVVAACRSFDLLYDTHLSQREWIKQIAIGPLDWASEVEPIVQGLRVDSRTISERLKTLLLNPRMLYLFEEIARREAVPRVDTEQDLTEAYLDTVVVRSPALGERAMDHISRLAAQMLAERRLDVPQVRAGIPREIEKALLSAEVLVEASPGRLAFAHQTLMDVLAVRYSQRAGHSLLKFITQQPQTPFIRPTIRAFFFYLRSRDPTQFRKQVRAALDSSEIAFHLKRLLTDSVAELDPRDEDWPLVNHLLRSQPVLFDSLFLRLRSPHWFRLLEANWLPELLANKDAGTLIRYAERISLLKHSDPLQMVSFWRHAISLPYIDRKPLRMVVGLESRDFKAWTTEGMKDVVEWLVNTASDADHDFAAGAICRFVEATDGDDELLWRYITAPVGDPDAKNYRFGDKLRCGPNHDPIPKTLATRMVTSDTLLTIATSSVNDWSRRRMAARKDTRPWGDHFLNSTSYSQKHTQFDRSYVDPPKVLFGAIETACLKRAAAKTGWWTKNEILLRQSTDGALRYIALRAYTDYPESNLLAIGEVLRDETMIGLPRLRYEIDQLIHASLVFLPTPAQDALESHTLRLGEGYRGSPLEVLMWRRDRLAAVPTFLRSPVAQRFLDEVRTQLPDQEGQPQIEQMSGFVPPAISDAAILQLSHETLLNLLNYVCPRSDDGVAAFRNVSLDQFTGQLTVAASRDPERYLGVLRSDWTRVPGVYRPAILDGVTNHLRFRFGNLTSSTPWEPLMRPEGAELASALLTEIEAHWYHWRDTVAGAQALNACAYALDIERDAERFAFLLVSTWSAADASPVREDDLGLLTAAMNSPRGIAAEAAGVLARRIGESGSPLPVLLVSSLKFFAKEGSKAARAMLIHYLPAIQAYFPDLGWQLFSSAINQATAALWNEGERCFYYAYHRDFSRVEPFLAEAEAHVPQGAGAMWGRITALAVLSEHVSLDHLVAKLQSMGNADAWRGAASVFATNAPQQQHQEVCFSGLRSALDDVIGAAGAVLEMTNLLRADRAIAIPQELLRRYFDVLGADEGRSGVPMYDFQKWLVERVRVAPDEALVAAEIATTSGPARALHTWDPELYPRILTSLFREAEDREELDSGAFLKRVIAIQDSLIKLGGHRIDDWLAAAERP